MMRPHANPIHHWGLSGLVILLFSLSAPARETGQVRPEPDGSRIEGSAQSYSEDVLAFIDGTWLSHAAGLPDPSETVDTLRTFLDVMEIVNSSIKERIFEERPQARDSTSAEQELYGAALRLEDAQLMTPESRSLAEGLGRVYLELFARTENSTYLLQAEDAFLSAEELGMAHAVNGEPHYTAELADVFTILGDRAGLDRYFEGILAKYPLVYIANLDYAQALARTNDGRAESFYSKAISLRPQGNFNSVVFYAEYLLDRGEDQAALELLQSTLTPEEDHAYYPHFLKGLSLERLAQPESAGSEYKLFQRFNDIPKMSIDKGGQDVPFQQEALFRPAARYRIQGSELQRGIRFEEQAMQPLDHIGVPDSVCPSPQTWECKARYYAVKTLNGEARDLPEGSYRAVGWSFRARAVWLAAWRECPYRCYCDGPHANGVGYTTGNLDSLYRRYYYVIDQPHQYVGLGSGNYNDPVARQVWTDVFNGAVPDPTTGLCLDRRSRYGSACEGYCQSSTIWFYIDTIGRATQFRAGVLVRHYPTRSLCWWTQLDPSSTPSDNMCCGIGTCWSSYGVVCPRYGYLYCNWGGTCFSCPRQGWRWGADKGNFFWRPRD
ncbi:MAG: tetratricopeptide repeat protein [Acidobacteria bacterium]|nr:tetratricopeptide repeat protein [Acidobacteriota bacterium]